MSNATIFSIRNQQQEQAVILLHGFSGDAHATFGLLPAFLAGDPRLYEWDIHCFGYPTSLKPDLSGVWAADPDLAALAGYLQTAIETVRFGGYRRLALIAHSMGGLIVQRALLDGRFVGRLSHVLLFGAPSNGLSKARWGKLFKRQVRDMEAGGQFVTTLRSDWSRTFTSAPPFAFRAVAGLRDEFVPRASSVEPFDKQFREYVDGDHLQMVKPATAETDTSLLLLQLLAPSCPLTAQATRGPMITPPPASPQLERQRRADEWKARLAELSDQQVVELALAIDGTGGQAEALDLLERLHTRSTELTGVLAGRLKRRWLADPEGNFTDGERARQFYQDAFARAKAAQDLAQATYHGVNFAFMMLAVDEDKTAARTIAAEVLALCQNNTADRWNEATQGEAQIYLGDVDEALRYYALALQRDWNRRERDAMQRQAIWAARLLDQPLAEARLAALFDGAVG